jgi:hypothetical protein
LPPEFSTKSFRKDNYLRYFKKFGQTAVIGLLHFGRKITGGKFFVPTMISQAFTADTFAAAWFIGAVAMLQVLLFIGTFRHAGLL